MDTEFFEYIARSITKVIVVTIVVSSAMGGAIAIGLSWLFNHVNVTSH